jgi:hypothetical protein
MLWLSYASLTLTPPFIYIITLVRQNVTGGRKIYKVMGERKD